MYTSSDPREILRFASGAYAQGNTRISVVLEFKTTPQDLHIDSTPYECAIHLPSVKSENVLAVYVLKNQDIVETYVNPYLHNPRLNYRQDISRAKSLSGKKQCLNFEKIDPIKKTGIKDKSVTRKSILKTKLSRSEDKRR